MVVASNVLVLGITAVFFLVVLGVGTLASRSTSTRREDYLMADRSFGTLVLFAALFATNMSAVVIIGASGLAYGTGIGAFGFFVGLFVFLFPVLLMTVGYRVWLVGKEFNHITPSQILNHRWNADYLGLLTMAIYTVWMIPELVVALKGGGIVFEIVTDGLIPYWAGALIVSIIVGVYVYQGGMRGTGWTNVVEAAVFLLVLVALFFWIPFELGGFDTATAAVAQIKNGLFLNRAGISLYQPKSWFSQGLLVVLGAFTAPALFIRYMTGKSVKSLQQSAIIYPIAIILVWVPVVLIGFWGIAQLPNLARPDYVLPAMADALLPVWVVGFALTGILAALMSSLDAAVLTTSTLFSQDVLRPFFDIPEERETQYTRAFLVVIFVAGYIATLLSPASIIEIATFSLAGQALMFFPICAVFYWRRSNKYTAYAGLIWGFVGLWMFQLGLLPMSLTFGFGPIIPMLVSQLIVMVVVTYTTPEPPTDTLEQYERLFQNVW